MDTWMRVHDVTTRQEWEATQPKPAQPETFYDRWYESTQRLQQWCHVEQRDDQ